MKRIWPLLLGALCPSCTVTPLVLCDQIPEGGCPLDRGGTCDDMACEAIYGCYDGVWQAVELCDGNTGGAGGSGATSTGGGGIGGGGAGGGGAGGGGAGGGECTPLSFDHTGETTGCIPGLQSPDCPGAVAEGCAEKACTTGCLDFYLCKADGWVSVAYCDEDGNFFEAPR